MPFDVVILGGHAIDPESGLDAPRNVGLEGGRIGAVTDRALEGRRTIDARGLVVAPGFIDLHSHGQDPENYALKAQDGVTTALELEVGAADVDAWYAEREGRAHVNFGVAAGHIPVRMAVMGDPPGFLPRGDARCAQRVATDAERDEICRRVREGLRRGALAVGFGIQYTPAAARSEIVEVFRVAAEFGASCHVHLRNNGVHSSGALEEAFDAARSSGAPLHVVHLHSTSLGATERHLRRIDEERARGMDVTTECYPYTAGMTDLASGVFNEGWREAMGIGYGDLVWIATGERLTAESFEKYRKQGGLVAVHSIPPEAVRAVIGHPLGMIASDGIMARGKGHPRAAGTYARLLGRYVREEKAVTLSDAIRKSALMPAQRLERHAPAFRKKGRLQEGCDADLVVFDPERVADRATYEEPSKPSEGFVHVFVGGVAAVSEGRLGESLPGRPVRGG